MDKGALLAILLFLPLLIEPEVATSHALPRGGTDRIIATTQVSPFIKMIPNGEIPKGQTEGFNTIVWNAGSSYPYCEIYMTVNNGEETEVGRGHDGKARIAVRLGSTYVFKMIVYLGDRGDDVRDVTKLTVVAKVAEPGTGTLGKRRRPAETGVGNRSLRDERRETTSSIGSLPETGVGNRSLGDARRETTSSIGSLPFFYDVRLVPLGDSFELSFKTFEPSQFFIEVSKGSPYSNLPTKTEPGQALPPAFPRFTRLAAFTLPGLSGIKKEHQASIRSAPGQILEADALYHYVITAKATDGSFHRYVGQFANTSRTVKVIFERVKIINDGDPDPPLAADCGEIDLWFWANYGLPGAQFFIVNNLGGGRACSDNSYNINRDVVVLNAPHTLSLSISGRDRDTDDSAGSDLFGPAQPPPFSGPRDTGDEEQNVAANEFDLSQLEINTTIPFTLVSMRPRGGDGGDLMFVVYGRIVISTPRQR